MGEDGTRGSWTTSGGLASEHSLDLEAGAERVELVTGREERRAAELEDERAPGREAFLAGVEQAAVGAEAVALGEDGVSRLGSGAARRPT